MNKKLFDSILLDAIEKYLDEDTIVKVYSPTMSLSPEDIYIEKESRLEGIKLIEMALIKLPPIDKEIVYKYVIENKTLKVIAEELGKHHTSIMRRLDRIPSKMETIYRKSKQEVPYDEMKEMLFYRTPGFRFSSSHMGYPFDIARMTHHWSGFWTSRVGPRAGQVTYMTAFSCKVHKYLADSFKVKEGEIGCSYCYQCQKKVMPHIKISKLRTSHSRQVTRDTQG